MWTFDDGTAKDSVGNLDGTLHGSATIVNGQLVLDGNKNNGGSYMSTAEMGETFTPHTLVAWLTLTNLTQSGGAAISIVDNAGQGNANEKFDAIVYGERTAKQWLAGSEFWNRTPINNGGALESTLGEHMIAITYSATGISIYRDGQLYASGGSYSPFTFSNPIVLLGLRHAGSLGSNGLLKASINAAAIYDAPLTASQLTQLEQNGPTYIASVPEAGTWAMMIAGFGMVGAAARRRRRATVLHG